MATAEFYVINPKELPSYQAAAALFDQDVIVDASGASWCQSPYQNDGEAVMMSFADTSISDRDNAAGTTLVAEQNKQVARQTQLEDDIAQLTAVTP
jgi:hypothetical protein